MLALYDATDNALQRIPVDLRRDQLYERLLRSFSYREIRKLQPGLPERDLDKAIDQELHRLSIVAFAMFNRGSQWVTETALNDDLAALLGQPAASAPHDLRARLSAAEMALGRFFFVHRAQATRDGSRLEAYEFLHATFGEFLIARLIEQMLGDITVRAAISTMPLTEGPPDDDLLHALLSFRVLCARASIVGFLIQMVARLTDSERDARAQLLKRLFLIVHMSRTGRHFDRYEPTPVSVPTRYAMYGANLLLLIVCTAGSVQASELFSSQSTAIYEWHRQALLWRSQLDTEEWISMVDTFAADRIWSGDMRDIRLRIDDGSFTAPAIDPNWTYEDSDREPSGKYSFSDTDRTVDALRRKANFLCGINDDVMSHTVEPLGAAFPKMVGIFVGGFINRSLCSATNALLDVWLLPVRDPQSEDPGAVYERCAAIATGEAVSPQILDDDTRRKYAALLLDRLTMDTTVLPSLAADILSSLSRSESPVPSTQLATRMAACCLAFLGRDRESDNRLAEVLLFTLRPGLGRVDAVTGLEAWVRLAELGLPVPSLREENSPSDFVDLLRSVAQRRPDLASRAQRVKGRRAER